MKFLLLAFGLVATTLGRPSTYYIKTNVYDKTLDHHAMILPVNKKGHLSTQFQIPLRDSADVPDRELLKLAEAYLQQSDEAPESEDEKHDKQIYFYSAPEIEEPQPLRIRLDSPNTKRTDVIFVKVPKPGPIVPQLVAPRRPPQEKTKVYVFVKDTENLGKTFTLPAPETAKAKPEVFIVKYKSQEDADVDSKDESSLITDIESEMRFGTGLSPNLTSAPGNKDAENKDTQNKDAENKDAANKDAENKDAANKDADKPPSARP